MDENTRELLRKELEVAREKIENCWQLCYDDDGGPLDKDAIDVLESVMGSLAELIGGSEDDAPYDSDCEYSVMSSPNAAAIWNGNSDCTDVTEYVCSVCGYRWVEQGEQENCPNCGTGFARNPDA